MHRFYCDNLPDTALSEPVLSLDADQARHARRVLRLQPGDGVELFDGRGRVAQAQLVSFDGGATLKLISVQTVAALRPCIELATAMPKGGRADDMVNQFTQLGVDRITPLRTRRSSVDPRDAKLERLQRIAVEAAKQCGRAWLPVIDPMMDLQDVLPRPADLRLAAALSDDAQPHPSMWREAARIQILIGPEGGWSDEEHAQLKAAGSHLWRLGPHTLRIETAAAAAVALLRYLSQ